MRRAAKNFLLEGFEQAMNFGALCPSRPSQRNDKRPPIALARPSCNQPASLHPVEDAGQRRALMRKGAMQTADSRIAGFNQMAQDVGLGLTQSRNVSPDEESDPVRSAVNREGQLKRLHAIITISYYSIMKYMTDSEFVQAFEACQIPGSEFHHRDHIRLAAIYCRTCGPAAAARIAESIRRYAAHLGKSDKYHQTITMAWMGLVEQAIAASDQGIGFEELVARFPALLDKNLLREFYTEERLDSPEAKVNFVPPDRKPFCPALARHDAF